MSAKEIHLWVEQVQAEIAAEKERLAAARALLEQRVRSDHFRRWDVTLLATMAMLAVAVLAPAALIWYVQAPRTRITEKQREVAGAHQQAVDERSRVARLERKLAPLRRLEDQIAEARHLAEQAKIEIPLDPKEAGAQIWLKVGTAACAMDVTATVRRAWEQLSRLEQERRLSRRRTRLPDASETAT
jgi:hypothetical protein